MANISTRFVRSIPLGISSVSAGCFGVADVSIGAPLLLPTIALPQQGPSTAPAGRVCHALIRVDWYRTPAEIDVAAPLQQECGQVEWFG
jgi:hypothetical protein